MKLLTENTIFRNRKNYFTKFDHFNDEIIRNKIKFFHSKKLNDFFPVENVEFNYKVSKCFITINKDLPSEEIFKMESRNTYRNGKQIKFNQYSLYPPFYDSIKDIIEDISLSSKKDYELLNAYKKSYENKLKQIEEIEQGISNLQDKYAEYYL